MTTIERIDGNKFGRAYMVTIDEQTFFCPSVTTILSKMPNPKLDKMREEMGAERMEKARDQAAQRGTVMHKWLEIFLEHIGSGCSPEYALELTQDEAPKEFEGWPARALNIGRNLFYNFYYSEEWKRVNKIVFSESFMHTVFRGGWAGTADFAFIDHEGKCIVWDFKSASDMRTEEEVKSYMLQVSAYLFMYIENYKDKPGFIYPTGGEILMANEKDSKLQKFYLPIEDMKGYLREFIALRQEFELDEHWQEFVSQTLQPPF